MDREAWCAAIHGVTKSWTRLSDWTELNWTDSFLKPTWLHTPRCLALGSDHIIMVIQIIKTFFGNSFYFCVCVFSCHLFLISSASVRSLPFLSFIMPCSAGDPCSVPGLGRSFGEWICYPLQFSWTSLVVQWVIMLSMSVTWVQSLGWEDPLEKGKATYSSILPWIIPQAL